MEIDFVLNVLLAIENSLEIIDSFIYLKYNDDSDYGGKGDHDEQDHIQKPYYFWNNNDSYRKSDRDFVR